MVGIFGNPPDGNKKYVLNPTVVIPELTILIVWLFPSEPPLTSTVVIPAAVSLKSSFERSKTVVIPDTDLGTAVVIPTSIPVSEEPSPV